jgi:MFS family permease
VRTPSSPAVAQPDQAPRSPTLWRNRDYMLLWSGQIVSSIGTQASMLAFPLLVLAITRSPAQAGFTSALRAVPYLIFSLPAGALVDRWDRKRLMLLCDVGRALALGSIPVALALGRLTVAQVYLVSLVEGSLFVFFNLSEAACLPRVVLKEQLPAATAQKTATDSVSLLVGPPLGGALFGVARALPFLGDALSYGASVVSLFFIRTRFQGERGLAQRRLHVDIGEGLAWLWGQPLIRYMAFLTGTSNLVGNGTFLIAIVIAQSQHASSFVIGAIFTIASVGGIAGSLVAVRLQRRFSFAQVIIACVWVWAALTPLLALAPNPYVLGLVLAGSFLAGTIYDVVQYSSRLALIPDALQGRVNSVFRLIAFGGQPVGYALAGVLLQTVGPVASVLFFSVPYVAAALLTTTNPHVRTARALDSMQVE